MDTQVAWFVSCVRARLFKSFGATFTEATLGPSLVGIAGPNGSGKSTLLQCILFATGWSATELGVRCFKDLCNTQFKHQLCEVELRISKRTARDVRTHGTAGRNTSRGSGSSDHVILHAALAADGSRVFTVDGKNKTGIQVKELLRSMGISLDNSMAVIRQASVTKLADSNSAEAIGSVLEAASGLARWREETSKAQAELQAARAALHDITANIKRLEGVIGADDLRLKQVEQLRQLEAQEVQVAHSLAAAYSAQQAACAAVLERCEGQLQHMQAQLTEHQAQLATTEGKLQSCKEQRAALEAQQVQDDAVLALVQRVATLHAQAAALQEHVAQATAHKERYEQLQGQVSQAHAEAEAAQQALDASESRYQTLCDILEQHAQANTSDTTSAGANATMAQQLLSACQQRVDSLQRACQELATQLQSCCSEAQEVTQDMARLSDQHKQLQAALTASSLTPSCAEQRRQELEQISAGLRDQLSSLHVQRRVLQTQLNTAQARHPAGTAPSLPCTLQHLFNLKPDHAQQLSSTGGCKHAAGARQWCRALSVVAGASLEVVVTATSGQASEVLRDPNHMSRRGMRSGTLRVWPLDRITLKDLTHRQREAQAALGADKVVLPLDLLEYPPAVHSAMLRAFGGLVLAADSQVAAQLAQQWGLASVTPDGTVSRQGSVRGGYRGRGDGPGSPAGPEAVFLNKLELTQVEAQCSTIIAEQQRVEAELKALDQHKQQVAEEQQVSGALKAAASLVTQLRQRKTALQIQLTAKEAQLALEQQQEQRYLDMVQAAQDAPQQQVHNRGLGVALEQQQGQELSMVRQQLESDRAAAATAARRLRPLQADVTQLTAQQSALMMMAADDCAAVGDRCTTTALGDGVPVVADCRGPQPDEARARRRRGKQDGKAGSHKKPATAGTAAVTTDKLDTAADSGVQRWTMAVDLWDLGLLAAKSEEAAELLQEAERQLQRARQEQSAADKHRVDSDREHEQHTQLIQQLKDVIRQDQKQLQSLKWQVDGHQQQLAKLKQDTAQLQATYKLRLTAASQPGATPGAASNRQQAPEAAPSDIVDQGLAAPSGGADTQMIELQKHLKQINLAKRSLADVQGIPAPELLGGASSRRDEVAVFREHMRALSGAVDALEQGIRASHHQVLATHGSVNAAIATRFQELCTALLPSYRFTLAPLETPASTAQQAQAQGDSCEQHPVIHFQRVQGEGGPTLDTSDSVGSWSCALEQLSGGQRTLVSLALLLAAALEGSSSSVVLLDEVDAALDEANQTAVARLLSALAQGTLGSDQTLDTGAPGACASAARVAPLTTSGRNKRKLQQHTAHSVGGRGKGQQRTQVLCVTHHSTFTSLCDSVLQVARDEHGTTCRAHAGAAPGER